MNSIKLFETVLVSVVLLNLIQVFKLSLSLSSHSPLDLLAYPKYSVNLADWNDAINNKTATDLLNHHQAESDDNSVELFDSKSDPSSDSQDQDNLRYKLMRSSSGRAFLCQLPPISSSSKKQQSSSSQSHPLVGSRQAQVNDLDRSKEKERIQKEGLKNGLKLISALKDKCIYTRLGWFTYSFCYGKGEIRQFHAVMTPGHNHPHEDPNQDVYILGFHLDHPQNPHHQAKLDGTLPTSTALAAEGELTSLGRSRFSSGNNQVMGITDVLRDEAVSRSDSIEEDDEFGQKKYLVQRWEGGTICDMTGKPRAVEVQFHCSTIATDHIALLRETSICEYLLVIHTPRLCSEPLFLAGGGRRTIDAGEMVNKIGCRPILTDEELEKWKTTEQVRQRKKEEQEIQKQKTIEEESTPKPTETGPTDEVVSGHDQADSIKNSQTDISKPDEQSQDDIQDSTVGNPEAHEELPNQKPDQTVLGTSGQDESTQTKPESSSDSTKNQDEKKQKSNSNADADPITLYFDIDTGRIYRNNPTDGQGAQAKSEMGNSRSSDNAGTPTDSQSTSSTSPQSNVKTESRSNQGDAMSDLEDVAKALKQSLASLKESGSNYRKSRNSGSNNGIRSKSSNEGLKSLNEVRKMSSEYSQLHKMYEQKFEEATEIETEKVVVTQNEDLQNEKKKEK
ncbi:hypothetical protein O181_080286 [Austropuccinia psidii MF-1]|uniref:Protein OS-9 homolog n=1 Tax=Austropuccinia psidii MF-1 TaxID=1389203 RepID=A0A9Q3FHX4_9BASI|nr:hypothetical protein [Austropuccinia psidii MF-1]